MQSILVILSACLSFRRAHYPEHPIHSFKKTKAMSELLEERSERQRRKRDLSQQKASEPLEDTPTTQNLKSLVESVKRKSSAADVKLGKRRKI